MLVLVFVSWDWSGKLAARSRSPLLESQLLEWDTLPSIHDINNGMAVIKFRSFVSDR